MDISTGRRRPPPPQRPRPLALSASGPPPPLQFIRFTSPDPSASQTATLLIKVADQFASNMVAAALKQLETSAKTSLLGVMSWGEPADGGGLFIPSTIAAGDGIDWAWALGRRSRERLHLHPPPLLPPMSDSPAAVSAAVPVAVPAAAAVARQHALQSADDRPGGAGSRLVDTVSSPPARLLDAAAVARTRL
uniref:Uncharacterized protein n=1 Tax=Plectus sambesii TaxID=2011161 RepID=A0A914WDZ8_9BILA